VLRAVTLAMVGAAAFGASSVNRAVAHDDPCHSARTCPSDDHSYLWSGMSCTSLSGSRLPEDQIPVDHEGVRYWCHVVTDRGMTNTTPSPARGGCEGDRAGVRTLRDAAASKVDFAPKRTSVARLDRMRVAASTTDRRRRGIERTVFRLRGRLVDARLSKASEWTLTVRDLVTRATVVAGFPAATCTTGAPTALRQRIATARSALIRACGIRHVADRARLRGAVTIDGVGFVPSRGATRTSVRVELRPVIGVAALSCRRR